PVLGATPSNEAINRYFAATALLHVGAVVMMPDSWRGGFQWATMSLESSCVGHNASLGVWPRQPIGYNATGYPIAQFSREFAGFVQ
ncbi:MAG TPA: hypothetical protein VKA48_10535, partial [Gammaproteobacteria bacterium]|nr:hypothetical protein [Gammaproteobacteria bacterium]